MTHRTCPTCGGAGHIDASQRNRDERDLNETERRALLTLMWASVQCAGAHAQLWSRSKKRVKWEDFWDLSGLLFSVNSDAETLLRNGPGNAAWLDHKIDQVLARRQEALDELDKDKP